MEVRTAVRAIVVDAADRVLLHHVEEMEQGRMWLTPGGGIEAGEDDVACLKRELWEEAAIVDADIGAQLWFRHHVFRWNGNDVDQTERYYLVRVDSHEAVWQDQSGEQGFLAHRWWTLAELLAADGELFVPRLLPKLVERVLTEGPPAEPFDCGV